MCIISNFVVARNFTLQNSTPRLGLRVQGSVPCIMPRIALMMLHPVLTWLRHFHPESEDRETLR